MVNNNTDLWLRISGILCKKKKKKGEKREQSVSDSLFQSFKEKGTRVRVTVGALEQWREIH